MTNNNDKKVLNVPPLRFPEFTEEWGKCKVSDLLDIYSTNSLSWEQLEYDTNTIMNLHYGLIHVGLPTMVNLTKDKLPNIKEGNMPKNFELCKEGDVAFADASEDTNEVAKTVEFFNLAGKDIVCGLHTIHGRDNKNRTVIGYKGYAFSSTAFHNQIRRIAQGTKIYSISSKNFSECYIGLPSKPEQTKIATLLRLIDERIVTQNKIIEKLETLIKGIRHNIFKQLRKDVGSNATIDDILSFEQPQRYIVSSAEYSNDDTFTPVLTANKAFILGYTTETDGIYDKGDCIIIDDFTLDCKYVSFPFKVKSSAIKILTANNKFILRYTYEYLKSLELSTEEHKRHYIAEVQPHSCVLPDNKTLKIIALMFERIADKLANEQLLAFMLNKQKQYLLSKMFI